MEVLGRHALEILLEFHICTTSELARAGGGQDVVCCPAHGPFCGTIFYTINYLYFFLPLSRKFLYAKGAATAANNQRGNRRHRDATKCSVFL